ncbi:hypothetical protein [uncultured Fibrobacter sp.]|uniref:hypothetical protein n=1 Tax=uncultured Fibrobacter sp. TaxID=261512 RepID=UPI0025DCC2CC|nr:hypothetical protein [uncultured Fibrobacter sp.]
MDFRWRDQPQPAQPINMGGQAAFDAYSAAMGAPVSTPVQVQPFEAERQELAALESQLAEIDRQIEQFDRENPGFSSGMVDVAAKRAEAGDMNAYNSMVQGAMSMQQGAAGARKGGEAGVWNSIDEARKLAFGLDDTSDETREARVANIRVMLDKARRDATAAGIELPIEWHELDRKISQVETGAGADKRSILQWGNELWTKSQNGTLSDDDIKDMESYIAKNPNGELSKDLQAMVQQYKGRTQQAKAKAKAKNEKWESWFYRVVNAANIAEEIAKLSREEYEEFKKRFTYDPKTGELKRI